MLSAEDWRAYLRWRPHFADAIDETLYPLAWLDARVWHGQAMFDHAGGAAILSEWKRYPSGAWQVEGLVAAGVIETIKGVLIPLVEARGRNVGAVASVIASRPGWMRVLRQNGYAPYQSVVRKALRDLPQTGI